MSLLREIQDAAVSSKTRVSDLLRRCKILAARLKSEELAQWVEHELNGYPSRDALPDYRVVNKVQSRGNFVGYANSQLNGAPIPYGCLPEKYRDWARTEYMNAGISTYERLMDKDGGDGMFTSPWPADLTASVSEGIYQHMNCLQAWKEIPRGVVVNLLDSVRNRVLGFALEIEKANPDAGDAAPNSTPVPDRVVRQVFHTEIHGNVGNIASGTMGVTQHSTININQGDFASLEAALTELGIAGGDVTELKQVARC